MSALCDTRFKLQSAVAQVFIHIVVGHAAGVDEAAVFVHEVFALVRPVQQRMACRVQACDGYPAQYSVVPCPVLVQYFCMLSTLGS